MSYIIFMTVMDFVIPLMMLGFGKLLEKNPPEEINYSFGYRTRRATINNDTWDFANRFFGKIWFKMGCIVLPVTAVVVILLFVTGIDDSIAGKIVVAIMFIQMAVLISAIFPTESALKKTFDKAGNRLQA